MHMHMKKSILGKKNEMNLGPGSGAGVGKFGYLALPDANLLETFLHYPQSVFLFAFGF